MLNFNRLAPLRRCPVQFLLLLAFASCLLGVFQSFFFTRYPVPSTSIALATGPTTNPFVPTPQPRTDLDPDALYLQQQPDDAESRSDANSLLHPSDSVASGESKAPPYGRPATSDDSQPEDRNVEPRDLEPPEANVEKEQQYVSCMDIARKVAEPYTAEYRQQDIEIYGPVYAYYQWEGPITKDDFEQQRHIDHLEDCRVLIKVKDRQLYVYTKNRCYGYIHSKQGAGLKDRYDKVVELMLLALEVYEVADVDFVLELEDSDRCPEKLAGKLPVMSYSLKANASVGKGFTFPSFGAYTEALGKKQMAWYRRCLGTRYPRHDRLSQAVWRGTTTGTFFKTREDVVQNRRVALSQLAVQHPSLLNTGVVGYLQADLDKAEVKGTLETMAPVQGWIAFEHFNFFEAVIDVDGNAWSDRFFRLMAFVTPILKQEYSDWREYFSHGIRDEEHVVFFKQDLSDLLEKVQEILRTDEADLTQRMERSYAFAVEHLSQLGVIRAMAYSMVKYGSLIQWDVEREEKDYQHIPRSTCCEHNKFFPKELLDRLKYGGSGARKSEE